MSASQAEAEHDAYAAHAVHQLGEAVALMEGYLALLQKHIGDDAEAEELLRGLGAGIERTRRFVDDLLDLTATNRAELVMELVYLEEALSTVRARLAVDLRATGAQIHVTAPLPVVHADRELVILLLKHLVRAALAAGAHSVEIEGAVTEDRVCVELRDTGAPAGSAPFAPFAAGRGHGALVGAGVGLTASRRIVEAHGGTIALREDARGGTVVTFTLPHGDVR